MIIRKMTTDGDMVFGQGANNFITNKPDGVAQAVMTSLKLFEGEWFIDVSAGVPFDTKVFGFGNMPFYDFIIQEAILNTIGVNQIISYTSYISQNRNVTINVTIDTLYGTVNVSTTL